MTTTPGSERLADLVARCILLLETGEIAAAEALLSEAPDIADAARQQLQSLRDCGLLREGAPRTMPEAIGPYRVLELIGYGGMGAVYLAEQPPPVRRRVAVKVIRPGMDTREVLARFAVEQQTLGVLDHPNIAKIYDAGSTEEGHPYLVMEYVAGEPLGDYCNGRRLTLAERERLLADVCDTIQHAHNAGILHRDLKPSNILVVDENGRAQPKVIDFGVAKSTQPRAELATLLTQHGKMLGTPEYMSPEQAAHRVDIDARTDVYALGAILYELLSGCLPIESERLRKASQAEVERLLNFQPAPPPSARFAALDAGKASELAAERGCEPRSMQRQLRGELDWICQKALEKDRNRRYRMPADLAADLRRHLDREPVLAGPPSAWYLFRCFAARYRLQVSAAALVLLSVIVGLVVSLMLLTQVHDEARRAETNAQWAFEAVDELLTKVAEGPLAEAAGAQPLRRDVLLAALRFQQRFTATYRNDPSRAEELERAYSRVGLVQSMLGDHPEAMKSYREAVRILDRLVAENPGNRELQIRRSGVRSTMSGDAIRQGDLTTARGLLEQAERELEAMATDTPDDTRLLRTLGNVQNNLAALHFNADDLPAAVSCYEEAIELSDRILAGAEGNADDRSRLVTRLVGLAATLFRLRRAPDAERALARGHDLLVDLIADTPDDRARRDSLANLASIRGSVAEQRGERTKAVAYWQQAAEGWRPLTEEFPNLPEYRYRLAGALINLANDHVRDRRSEAALALLDEAEQQLRIALRDAPRNAAFQKRLVKALTRAVRERLRTGPDERCLTVVADLLALDATEHHGRRAAAEILCLHLASLARTTESLPAEELDQARRLFDGLVAEGVFDVARLKEKPWSVLGRW